jgi:hypothetical protein
VVEVEIHDDNYSNGMEEVSGVEEVVVIEEKHEFYGGYNNPYGGQPPMSANTSVISGYPMMQPQPQMGMYPAMVPSGFAPPPGS